MQIVVSIENRRVAFGIDVELTTTCDELKEKIREKYYGDEDRSSCPFACLVGPFGDNLGWQLWHGGNKVVVDIAGKTRCPIGMIRLHYCGGPCRTFCRALIRVDTDDCQSTSFSRLESLGFGSNGEVHAVVHNETKKKLALKVVRCQGKRRAERDH